MLAMNGNAFRIAAIASKPGAYPYVSPSHEKSAVKGAFFMAGRNAY
ncbi:hypothetical protein [Pseudomonas piscis]